ncbi:hypothetical protein NC652_013906 [Populus alba x Populus x berolinensis]|nr:hypothetical protein NC652_013906 [Populus alba x Populus x berolinensis]
MEFTLHPLFLLQFLLLLPLLSSSVSYNPSVKYFMNCGSDTNVDLEEYRTFVGDENSNTSFSVGKSKSIQNENPLPGTSLLYHTARIYKKISPYRLDITQTGSYLVRLHFFPFSSKGTHLADALFNVSASNFSLLTDFRVPNSTTEFPVIKEFFLTIAAGNFKIYFQPAEETTFAFVNAIEAFLLPPNFYMDNSTIPPLQTKDGALRTLYRINVGGPEVNDTLWRNWVPDDDYLAFGGSGANRFFGGVLHEARSGGLIVQKIAPESVYTTCREASVENITPSNYFNVTWSFNVSKNAMHFVRVHFCDFVSPSPGALLRFNLYIYSNFSFQISPYDRTSLLAAPFYDEFVVDSDDSGIMNISIGPRQDYGNRTAFLNGLEIMEIMGELGKVARTSDPKNKNTSVFVVVGSVLGGLVLICILAVVLCLGRRCRKPKAMETLDWSPVPVHRRGSTDSRLQVPEGAMFGSLTPNLNLGLRISLAEIQFATNNFDIKKKIGKGGFGTVFRGTLSNGTEVAVKRSMPGSHQGLPEFQTEIIVLSKIRHRHLVSLIGYCDENSEMILVYEFMEKGTLRDHLYDSALPSLPWKQRLEICIGAANGLHYLHRGSSGGFIHRDVKSTNVLLDENYVAKVADFGLSRLSGPPDQTHVSTVVKGTFGYLDPDYFKTQQLTEKSDVYSFGVVLLEVLCARPAINTLLPLEQVNLAEWAMFCKKKGMLEQIVDASIRSEINLNCLRKFFDTAERCLEEYGVDRPNMGDVVWDLEYALQLQRTAMPRELHEDSTTDASAMLALPNIQHLPSLSMSMERDDMPMLREDLSNSPAIEVFSQLRIDDAR